MRSLKKTGVSDAAGAVEKSAGANVVGGKFAVVRGLADRYVATIFNGAQISTADPSKKAVQLDLFPTSAIDSINISKTYSPWLPGEFGGGTIDIVSRSVPDELMANFGSKWTWEEGLPDKIRAHPFRDLSFFGDSDSVVRDFLFRPDPTNPGELAFIGPEFPGAEAFWSELINNEPFKAIEDDIDYGRSYSFSLGQKLELSPDVFLGFIAAGGQSSQDEYNFSPKFRPFDTRTWNQEDFTRKLEWSIYLSGALQFGNSHEIAATFFQKIHTGRRSKFRHRDSYRRGSSVWKVSKW